MPTAYLCDFDGTASPHDIGAAFVARFAPSASADRGFWLDEWKSGRIGHRELTRRQCEGLRVSERDALAFIRSFRLDPHFEPFVRASVERADAVMVVSEGFDFYVREHLTQAGLGDLPFAANRAVFDGERVVAQFPFADASCTRGCGNCKAQHVRRYRALGFHTVLAGDGLSDRCGALAADTIFARAGLRSWCEAERIDHRPFEDFSDVAELARTYRPAESRRP